VEFLEVVFDKWMMTSFCCNLIGSKAWPAAALQQECILSMPMV
jgi:hypothetical protein